MRMAKLGLLRFPGYPCRGCRDEYDPFSSSLWEIMATSVPGFIQLKEGESVQDVLRRSERPNCIGFAHVELPERVQKPLGKGGTLGTSQVSMAGIR